MRKFFILKKGKYITGPFTLEQLKEKEIKETDKIWYDGLADWQPAFELEKEGITVNRETPVPSSSRRSLFFWKKRS